MWNWLRLAAVLGLSASAAWPVDWKTLKPQGYVSDFAQVLDAGSKAKLESYCAEVQQSTGAQIALVTLPSLQGEPPEDVANILFRTWGVGQKTTNEGILLLLAIDDRRSRLEVGYGLEPILPDGMAGRVLREMRPALRQKDYGDALVAAAQTIGSTIAQAKHVTLTQRLARRTQPGVSDSFLPWPVMLGGLLLLFWLMRFGGPRGYGGPRGGGFLPGLLLGNVLGRGSWGGNGRGGFGGYDSGDSFGGFGGGDSGGGGASSDW